MKQKNKQISAFQFALLGTFIATSLYEGIADIALFHFARNDAWLACVLAFFIGIIPLILFKVIFDFEPSKNLVMKIKCLFSKHIAAIINFIVALYVTILMLGISWNLIIFTALKYLTETPPYFISILFFICVFYAAKKGIESISRTGELLFYIVIGFHIIVTFALSKFVDMENLKPFIQDGFIPILKEAMQLQVYVILPLLILLIIPKESITNNKKTKKYFFFGYIFSLFTLTMITIVILTVVGVDLATLYRFPSYYVHKKIMFAGVIENVENFTATHWIISMYVSTCLCLHYLLEYTKDLFKIKSDKGRTIALFALTILGVLLTTFAFKKSSIGVYFMYRPFNDLFSIIAFFVIILITTVIIITKTKEKKKKSQLL